MLPLVIFNKISRWPDTAVVLDFCNKIKSPYSCLQLHLEPSSEHVGKAMVWQNFLSQLRGLYRFNSRGLCFPRPQPRLPISCPTWGRHAPDAHFLCNYKESCHALSTPWDGGSTSRQRACVPGLCSLAREGGCGLLCLGLWKFLRQLQMYGTALTFSSLTLTRVLCCSSSCSVIVFSVVMLL